MPAETIKPSITFTDRAREQIRRFIDDDGAPELSVRIRVASASPLDPRYELSLIEPDERAEGDVVVRDNGFDLVADPDSAGMLDGASVDWIESLTRTGFKVENPNLKPLGSDPLEGELPEKVKQVIEDRINPAVAQHGGQIHLVDVRDEVVYVKMSGGCQGCGLAGVTLTQGIRRMIMDALPEIRDIQDVTDHASGRNPYFD